MAASSALDMAFLENYARGVRDLGAVSRDSLRESLAAIDLRDVEMVEDLVTGACRYASHASATYAAQFYRGLSLLQSGQDFDAQTLSSYDRQATVIAIRGIYNQCRIDEDELDEEALLGRLLDRVEFEVNRASKVGVWRNGNRDPRQVRYARVPTGAETCAWCLMTAGLGYWFMTEEAASHTHRGCDCVIIADMVERPHTGDYRDVQMKGYDSGEYREMWHAAQKALAMGDVPDELSQRVDFLAASRKGYRVDTNGTLAVMRWKYGLK